VDSVYLSDLGGIVRHRWYILVLGLVATAGLAVLAVIAVPPKYVATASVVLLPPKTSDSGQNPYLALGGLQPMTDVVAQAMMSEDSIKAVQEAGGTDDYLVERDRTTSGPLLAISVNDQTPEAAVSSMQVVLDLIPTTLLSLQKSDKIRSSFHVTSSVVAQDGEPEVNRKGQLRAIVVALAAGFAGSLWLAGFIEGAARRRVARQTWARRSQSDPADGVTQSAAEPQQGKAQLLT
jgi:hypothetical protein